MRAPVLAALVLAACGGDVPSGSSSGPGITSVSESTSSSGASGDLSSSSSVDYSAGSSTSASTGTIQDVAVETDFGSGKPPGCNGKVDLLFVISRLQTMKNEQDQLLASFAGFIDSIEQKLEGFDVHIMTANPDDYWPGWTCETQGCIGPENWPNCGPNAEDYQCGTYAEMITPCDEELGAGLIFNAGGHAANKLCDLHDGHRYIVSGEPDMAVALECIAKVGVSGDDPRLGDAMIAALSPELNGSGGCNEGFLREDALLVVVLITDWNDDASNSYDKSQYEAIIAAKGDPSSVVMLAIVKNAPGEFEPAEACDYWGEPSFGIFEDLLSRFPYAVFGDTCTLTFAPFFDAAVGKISEACEVFVPQ